MNPKDHIFKFYSDPAHGWLEMPVSIVEELNMGMCQISEFSYYNKETKLVYIEQDCDLLNVKREYEKKFNQKLLDPDRVVHIDLDEDNFIRKLPSYVTYSVECISARPIPPKEKIDNQDQKLALVKTFLQFYNSTNSKLDEKLKSDIVWFGTGLTKNEFEVCQNVAKNYFI
ncbi:MAG: hypothetical protein CM15mL8_500 [Caudoviricetes sp.]|nr:MAG: hypothetical protein CM15mL8_500 [Caudoviricetes sp.]